MTRDLQLASLFQALADPTRLRILALLRSMELSVGELAQLLGQSQPRVSRHVRILSDSGMVRRRKEGSWVYLQLAEPHRTESLFALASEVDPDAERIFAADAARLDTIRADRAEAARRYFEAHAATWENVRALHIADTEIERAITELLDERPLGALLDIGTGTGRMLELFAPMADSAIGIDRSSEMLRLARVKLDEAGICGARLRQGDMQALPLADRSADSIILHQVLHYAQQPGSAIAEAARVLAPGGQLLVIDFAQHDRAELKEQDAHLRLGFADDAMRGWFSAAGVNLDRIERLGGGALTVILWRGVKAGSATSERVAA
ncbi:metalloregulator ArsR/SmtB family transcription factor [Sphingomonas sp. NSE70-1]|uniref:Metalloregulator ArsR/SmtB family transcription factor n=1 Tax=Sphingomonas caseinilyticus TaxID=2908205 RepID=A0ABT0RWP4_9SPHN|nr:metalloregulator ArsR/SmtB family transcription factor [Sphingomonas caseinilyticus]MCL6699415.1 metalloregulator ArsR/SmtB family transcription factor [Sphingomonas caseinilyticus]